MTPKASSLPARNSATSCSSDRSRRSRGVSEIRASPTVGARSADASTGVHSNPRGGGRSRITSREAGHHVLYLGVILERVHRQVLAVPRLPVPAVGHLRGQRDV